MGAAESCCGRTTLACSKATVPVHEAIPERRLSPRGAGHIRQLILPILYNYAQDAFSSRMLGLADPCTHVHL